jgi:cell volume regulation protein A
MEIALLLAVILSSTDAAAIFSILRRQAMPPRLSATLEVESAANDPMAILLTAAAVEMLRSGEGIGWETAGLFLWKFTDGPALGWLIARGAVFLFSRLNPQERGCYYVLLVGVILLSHGLTELAHGSGMFAAFTAGFVMGNSHFIYKRVRATSRLPFRPSPTSAPSCSWVSWSFRTTGPGCGPTACFSLRC